MNEKYKHGGANIGRVAAAERSLTLHSLYSSSCFRLNFHRNRKNKARRNFPDLNRPCDANWLLYKLMCRKTANNSTLSTRASCATNKRSSIDQIEILFYSAIFESKDLKAVLKNMDLEQLKARKLTRQTITPYFLLAIYRDFKSAIHKTCQNL